MEISREQNLRAWEHEHLFPSLPGLASMHPSGSVLKLLSITEALGIVLGTQVLDIGCGKGRNALFLARHGFTVTAFDAVEAALQVAQARAAEAGLPMALHLGAMDHPWPYANETFDVILDDTASMSIGYEAGLQVCRAETERVLKPGGYVVVSALAQDDPFLRRFPAGEEPHTVITPDGKIERLMTPEELGGCYPRLQLVHQEICTKRRPETWERRTIWTLLHKPR
jgi:2-polyprenyl-3-methyl-5-hydroxy-6-metoxy-1,4-benzoquinol methylase